MDRLKVIKDLYEDYKGVADRDFKWLIEQAERVHEQADVLRDYRDRLERYEKVLKDIATNCDNPSFRYIAEKALKG